MGVVVSPERDNLLTDFGAQTLRDRYLLPGEDYQGLFARVATAFSSNPEHAQRMYDYLSQHWVMGATPVLANGGTDRGLPISCYLLSADDTLDSILGTLNEMAWLSLRGGGIGTYWGGVRERGAKIGDEGRMAAEGVIPVMAIQNQYTRWSNQGDVRTASSANYLDIHHPEVDEFIQARKIGGDLERKTLSSHHGLMVSDAFMTAVRYGGSYELISPKDGTVVGHRDAKATWAVIMDMRLEKGEPYLVFTDTVHRATPSHHRKLGLFCRSSNLCTEIMLYTGRDHLGMWRTAVCCLSSLNAETFEEWKDHPTFIRDVMEFLDNLLQDFIDRSEGVPGFENARYSAMRERSVGLGVMGFHNWLMGMRVHFEGAMAKAWNRRLFSHIKAQVDRADFELAVERGACPDALDAGEMRRFSYKTATAPTASISIICGGTSAGIEPIPGLEYVHKTDSGTTLVRNKHFVSYIPEMWEQTCAERGQTASQDEYDQFVEQVWQYVHEHQGSIQGFPGVDQEKLQIFKTAFELDQRWVVEHAVDRSDLIDQGQSVNVFFPSDADRGYISATHIKGYRGGLKSFYYLRSNSVQQAAVGFDSVGMPDPNVPDDCLGCQ